MNLRSDKRQNIQAKLDFPSAAAGEAQQPDGKEIESLPATHEYESPASTDRIMEEICEWKNLKEAMWRVKTNKGSAGIDGITVDDLPDYAELLVIRDQLLSGTYTPQPVKRVEIRKPDGGMRKLGIPTTLDRFVQQAVMQGCIDLPPTLETPIPNTAVSKPRQTSLEVKRASPQVPRASSQTTSVSPSARRATRATRRA